MSDRAHASLRQLLPTPKRVAPRAGNVAVPSRVTLGPAPSPVEAAVDWLRAALAERGHELDRAPAGHAFVRLEHEAWLGAVSSEAYALDIEPDGVVVRAASGAGLQHGLSTLAQLVRLMPREAALGLPALSIEDHPDFAVRGFMLDISRDKVPTQASLLELVDRLAQLKFNQLQLYMEHTFAYAGHEVVWREASPLTAEEVRELDAHARARHVELVPNQNSFGHFSRWLVHEPYRALAECPGGFVHPANWSGEPYGLCATDPSSLALLEDLYDQLADCFSSGKLNVGLDETLDLGAGRSRAEVEARGSGRVYLEFLHAVHARVRARGRVMQFWGDIIVQHPQLVRELPVDAIALEWGYEASHPWGEHLARFRAAGLPFYVCPGTSSWNSLSGRSDNALENIARAAAHGRAFGAEGVLLTDWGDHGHLQPPCVSALGLVVSAACAWNASDAERPDALEVPAWIDQHVLADRAGVLGAVLRDLGNAYRHTGSLRPNSSVLFWALIKPERLFTPAGVTRETLAATLAHVESASAALAAARPSAVDGELVRSEIAWVRDVSAFACRLGMARLSLGPGTPLGQLPKGERLALEHTLDALIEQHRAQWLARNRAGGLADSCRRLEAVRGELRGQSPR